jgi:S-adenosylmethionine:tRNA ribosyltransferase-isomerase
MDERDSGFEYRDRDPMDVADFDFQLPDELIAQDPPRDRGGSRLLVMQRDTGRLEFTTFADLAAHLRPGDLLVVNNTRVFPARLLGQRVPSGGAVECMLLARSGEGDTGNSEEWQALVHPGQKLKPGAQVMFEGSGVTLRGEILGYHFHGRRTVRLWTEGGADVATAIERIGHIPLPPYIKRDDRPEDRERYQTVYASERGSIAAPTAGLHFTDEQLASLASRGVERAEITLHVGYGTFKPVRAERVEEHEVDPERFLVGSDAAAALTRARREGRRIIAVGTTSARTLESLPITAGGAIEAAAGETRLFIHPGHEFRLVNGLITNFHLPRSSLLMLVAAFAGRDPVLHAYREAIARGFRFYSYGDAMVIL